MSTVVEILKSRSIENLEVRGQKIDPKFATSQADPCDSTHPYYRQGGSNEVTSRMTNLRKIRTEIREAVCKNKQWREHPVVVMSQ